MVLVQEVIRREVERCLQQAGPRKHILNVGHGVLQKTPEQAVALFLPAGSRVCQHTSGTPDLPCLCSTSKSGKVGEGTFPEQTWLTQCCCPQSEQLDGALQPSMSLAAGEHEGHPNDSLWPVRPSTPCSSPHTCICLAGAGIQQQRRCAEHQQHGKAQGNGESRSRLGWVLATAHTSDAAHNHVYARHT